MIRPPTPFDVGITDLPVYQWAAEWNAMQEALTAEWLIEQGFMLDPTEIIEWDLKIYSTKYDENKMKFVRDKHIGYGDGTVGDRGWRLEDKTQ